MKGFRGFIYTISYSCPTNW